MDKLHFVSTSNLINQTTFNISFCAKIIPCIKINLTKTIENVNVHKIFCQTGILLTLPIAKIFTGPRKKNFQTEV